MTPLFHRLFRAPLHIHLQLRTFTTTPPRLYPKPLPPRPTIHEGDITEAFLKGTGPGGQKINKTSSAVQLKHLPTGLVIKCQETRSRSQNRKIARRILAERIEDLEKGDESRSALKIERVQKKKASKDKKSRRKYRKLAEGEEATESPEGQEEQEEHDEKSLAQPEHTSSSGLGEPSKAADAEDHSRNHPKDHV